MSYEKNQKSEHLQSNCTKFRKITGFWKKKYREGAKEEFRFLKSGRINVRGIENFQSFGERTLLLVVPNSKHKRKGAPDYFLVAVEDYAKRA